MSHDVTAYRPRINRDAVREACKFYDNNDIDVICYDAYIAATQIASLSRAAGDPCNQIIYLALGVMDADHYAGCSGAGARARFTRDDLCCALAILDRKDFTNLQPDQLAIEIMQRLEATIGGKLQTVTHGPHDAEPERRFLQDCLAFFDAYDYDGEIEIQFA